ncbi:LuxR C-terminal-related transcriptional regulator [Ornithinibacillus salinisoli]|uniref:LuxR C-terminal-related transcriptional regulator n=1 Tax=Ornithinibacillus salinisoli TaxID=1848459 RepID=A0ABW4W2N5_9BACI
MAFNTNDDISEYASKTSDFIEKVEEDFFIGRHKERKLFQEWITEESPTLKVLHHYGTGGVGKSFLLNAYHRIAKEKNVLFLQLDSQEFNHTPAGFAEHLLQIIEFTISTNYNTIPSYSVETCLQLLGKIATKKRIILAIDTYEQMDDLDRWFRQVFVRNLPKDVFIVMAGRGKLKNEWITSSTWSQVTKQTELTEFNFEQSRTYLNRFNIKDDQLIHTIWKFSEGHPLTLSLTTLTNMDNGLEDLNQNTSHILLELTERWLKEVNDEEVHRLIYIAALFHNFDQASLSVVLEQEISVKTFSDLTSFSFIRANQHGWSMHDLIRDAIQLDLKHRNPVYYQSISERIVAYYYNRTIESRSPHDLAQFFYHLRNDFIQSVLFQEYIENSMYLEPVEEYNFHEVEAFFDYKRKHIAESEAEFYNRSHNKTYQFYASIQHNKKENELLGPEYIKKVGYNTTRLLKNEFGETIGLTIIVPINNKTLKYLATEPISKNYFDQLSIEELETFNVTEENNAGWYIRHIDYIDPANISAQSFLLYNLIPLLLLDGKIITSSSIHFFQDILTYVGFQEVPGATSYDFGDDMPSPTYMLDVRGSKLADYLKQFLTHSTNDVKIDLIAETLALTDREKDIVELLLEDKNNRDIANSLYLAEVTVKKHISRILKKANVKNRTQLIKQIMELV